MKNAKQSPQHQAAMALTIYEEAANSAERCYVTRGVLNRQNDDGAYSVSKKWAGKGTKK